jgi:hypothetical protein
MQLAKNIANTPSPATSIDDRDLVDVLHDLVDEYDAGSCDFSTLIYEVGAIIMGLGPHADPGWLAELGRTWVELRVLRAEQAHAGTPVLTETQSARAQALAAQIRGLVLSHDVKKPAAAHRVALSRSHRPTDGGTPYSWRHGRPR